jgi:hypothetical protein
MTPLSIEGMGKWLSERLEASGLLEAVPRENLNLLCSRAINFFFSGNTLQVEGIINWLEVEYGVPRERLLEVFSRLAGEAPSFGFRVELPGGGPGETEEGFAPDEIPHEGEEEAGSGGDSEDDSGILMEDKGQEASSQGETVGPSLAPPPSKARRVWQALPPKPRDPVRSLSAFLVDYKYFEFAFLDQVLGGECRKEPRTAAVLEQSFRPTPEEKEFLKDPGLEPGTEEDTVLAWTLRLNGRALAYAYALDLARNEISFDMSEWLRAVRQMNTAYGDISSRVLAKYAEAKKVGGHTLAAFETAWNRLRTFHERIAPQNERLSALAAGKEGEERGNKAGPGAKRPAPARAAVAARQKEGPAGGLGGFLEKNRFVVLIGAAALLAVFVFFGLYSAGLFKPSGFKEAPVDISGTGIKAERIFSDEVGLVVVVSDAEWASLDQEEKTEKLKALYETASRSGLKQVQVRNLQDRVLALILSPEKVKIF